MEWAHEGEEIKPEELPFFASWPEDIHGEIVSAELICQGVYYLVVRPPATSFLSHEYYAVQNHAEAISKEARTYGTAVTGCPGLLLFDEFGEKGGREIIDYELEKYWVIHGRSTQMRSSMHEYAIYGMELYPQYFGECPVPFLTPMGYTCRHKRIDNGVYWIETDQGKTCLAVCYPYCDEFSNAADGLALQTEEDRIKGIDNTLGYRFFPQEACCIPLFELMATRDWSKMISKPALMNAIWHCFPEYAAAYNMNEQAGLHDIWGLIQVSLGREGVELMGSAEHMIVMTPNAGINFFLF